MEADEAHSPDLRRTRKDLVSELRAIRAENAALRRSEALLRAVVEGIDAPVYAKDDRGRYLLVNPAAARLLGRAADEIVGREDAQLFPPDTACRTGEPGRRAMAGGQTVTFEDGATSAGLIRTYLTTEAPLPDDRGTIIGVIGIWRDVTEVRRAGKGRYAGSISLGQDVTERGQAEASPARDALLLANVRDSVIVTDPEGVVTYWNEGSTRLFGWRAEEMLGRPLTDRVPESARPAMLAEIRAIAEGKEFSGEWEDHRRNGSRVWIDARVTRITDASGRPIGLMGVAHDITERKKAEEALRASERQFRAVFEGALDAMTLVDDQSRFVDVNPAGCDLFGLPCAELLGKSVADFAEPGFDLERARAEYRRGIHRGSFRLVRPDGTVRETEYTATAEVLPGRHLSVLRDVTERKRTEEALREREAALRSFYDGAPMMMGIIEAVGAELVFVSVNAATAAFFGRDAESLQGLPVRELGDPDFERCRLTWLGRVGEARLTGRPVRFEYDLLRSDGPRRLSAIVCPIAAGRAARPRLSFIVEDVTERRRAEAELAEWKARYEAAVQATGQVLYDWDTTTNEVIYGGNCAAILGYTPEELSGDLTRMVDLIHPEDRAAVAAAIDRVRSTGEPCCLEYRIRRGDGAYIILRCDGYFNRLGVGPSTRLIGFLADVTARQRAEEALRASERRFRRVLENSRDVVYQLNLAGGTYDYLSPSVRDVLGRTPEELAAGGLSLAILSVHPEDRERREMNLARLMTPRAGAGFEPAHEYRVRVPGKGWRWMSDSGTVIRDERGVPVAVVGTLRDVTDQRMAAERLRGLSRRLIRAQEEERRHIARELHDEIGQSLTALKLNVRAAMRNPGAPDARRRLEESIGLVERTIGQVRDLSLDLHPSMLDDLGLLDALRSYASEFGHRSSIEVQFVADEEIGRLDPDVETACYRIAQEALTNVARHAGAGRVRVELRRSESELWLAVADDGAGFDGAAATTRAAGGSSLGLLGMRERAVFVGGRVEIESVPGRGTEVRAILPLGEARPAIGDDTAEG